MRALLLYPIFSGSFWSFEKAVEGLGKKVVVGGPYATSLPNDFLEAGADYLVLDEGEYTIPLFLRAL